MSMSHRVLVVDDDPMVRSFLSRSLTRAGFGVVASDDGVEVEDLLAERSFDLLVLDLQMPGMNGWEVIRRLRAQLPSNAKEGGRELKIVVVSGRDEPETAAFARRLGADAYLTKPFPARQLLEVVRQTLSGNAEGRMPGAE